VTATAARKLSRKDLMPRFLVEAIYTAEGHKGLAKDTPSGRKAAITQAVKKLGGKLDAIYFCLGENDVILIADMPDHPERGRARRRCVRQRNGAHQDNGSAGSGRSG